jgi:amino acid transporter
MPVNREEDTMDEDDGLRAGSVSLVGVIAQAVGSVSPELSLAFSATTIGVFAGAAMPAVMVLATVAALALARVLGSMASRNTDVAGTDGLIGRVLGARVGAASGAALSAFLVFAAASGLGAGMLVAAYCAVEFPEAPGWVMNWLPWAVVFGVASFALAGKGLRPAVWTLLALSAAGILVLTVLSLAVLLGPGPIAWSSLLPWTTDVSGQGFAIGVGLAFINFAGFESATYLSAEAVRPQRTIPRAMLWTVLVAGALYVVGSLALVSAYGGQKLHEAGLQAVFSLADERVGRWFAAVVLVVVMAAIWTYTLASLNEAARLLYSWGRRGLLPARFAAVGRRSRTPSTALAALALATVVIYGCAYAFAGSGPDATDEILSWTALMQSVDLLLVYGLVAIAGVVEAYRRRYGELFLPLVALAVIVYALYSALVPLPAGSAALAPVVGLLIALAGFAWGWRTRPQANMTQPARTPVAALLEMEGRC